MPNLTSKFQVQKLCQGLKCLLGNTIFQTAVLAAVVEIYPGRIYIRPMSLAFLTLFAYWIYKTHCIEVCFKTTEEFERRLKVLEENIRIYRQTKPTMFCVIASVLLGMLAVAGNIISGSFVVWLCLIFNIVIFVKYVFQALQLGEMPYWLNLSSPQVYGGVEEFCPDETEINMSILQKTDSSSYVEQSEDDESTSDEIPSELLIPDNIPDINESFSDDEQDEWWPVCKSDASALIKKPKPNDKIELKKGHFKRDSSLSTSSSSSEESLSKGLQFPDHTVVDGSKVSRRTTADTTCSQQDVSRMIGMIGGSSQALLAHSSKLIPSLMTGLVQGVLGAASVGPVRDTSNTCRITALDSSDESDFEILEQEDCQ